MDFVGRQYFGQLGDIGIVDLADGKYSRLFGLRRFSTCAGIYVQEKNSLLAPICEVALCSKIGGKSGKTTGLGARDLFNPPNHGPNAWYVAGLVC